MELRCDHRSCNLQILARVLLNECETTSDCRRSEDGKHLMRFQSETSVFKFLRRTFNICLKKFSRKLMSELSLMDT